MKNESGADDDRLAALARKGDPGALATLYRRHAPALLEYAARITGERAEGEDVLHETFLRVFQGRGTYRGRGRLRAWLFTIATRIARDRRRSGMRHAALEAKAKDTIAPVAAADPLDEAMRRQLLSRVESVLDDLPRSYAVAFHLHIREDRSYKEIASISGEPEGTLRSRVHHTLMQIRRSLASTGAVLPVGRGREEEKNER